MDKENSKFFSFVYKIIHFIFLLPINAIKYFCFGFYFVNLMCARIILFIMMIVSYPVYKMFKYLCLSLTFPIMIYNILRRNIKKNQNNSIEAPNNFEKEILDNNSLDLNKINDSVELDEINNNIEPNDPIIDIDSILAMDKLENKPFDLLDDGKIDIIDEQFFDLYANETQDNQQFIQENNNNESTIELFDNNKECNF